MRPDEENEKRELKAITTFCSLFGGSFKKLGLLDIDYKVFDKNGALVAYAEVTIRNRSVKQAYPLFLKASVLSKLADKRLNPVLIWACDDGLVYGKAMSLTGEIKFASPEWITMFMEKELMVFYEPQKSFKYVKYS
jgi:inorganic pyrophosphatase/exopolyphosphatase